MDKAKNCGTLSWAKVVAGVAAALILTFNLSVVSANEVEEKDIMGITQSSDQTVQNELTGVNQEAAETDAFGQAVADTDRPSDAAKAKSDFASGFKGMGAGFKSGTKATGRAFKKAGTTMGRGFKTAGTTMGKGFKKAGHGIKYFFTGKWLGKKDSVEERDLMAEGEAAGETQTDLDAVGTQAVDDDLELDFDSEKKSGSDDWVQQDTSRSEVSS